MPLREDLLEAIDGENPSGTDLRYDKVFDQLKEARIEEDDSLPSGAWERSAKKADRVLVIKVAGETLAKRSKDLRLTGWYLESLIWKEGFKPLPRGIEFLWKVQEIFWETIHPEREEDGNLDLRIGAIESSATLIAASVRAIPLTRNGFNWTQYQDAKIVGYESDGMSDEKAAARREAIGFGRATGEDLQRAIDGTPKAFYVETDALLNESAVLLDGLDEFQQAKYGDDYPSLGKLKSAIEEVKKVIVGVVVEKRKAEPDSVVGDEREAEVEESISSYAEKLPEVRVEEAAMAPVASPQRRVGPVGVPTDEQSAFEQVIVAAKFLRTLNSESPVPYLLCSALPFGQTRAADLSDFSFAVAPPTETRQAMRRLASEGGWDELMQLCLHTMASPCGRVWLDVQRYAWRAAREMASDRVVSAVVATVRGLLMDVPELRRVTMDDDTPAANAETQQWIDAEILPPVAESAGDLQVQERSRIEDPVYVPETRPSGNPVPDIFETAQEALKAGRAAEAISMLVRDSEQQPSGRMRFQRRVQMAQLCLMAKQAAVAYPVLRDLSSEMERRSLDTWEAAEVLSLPLSLFLKCLNQRKASEQEREAVFERLCRLDPQAALTADR